MPPECRGTMLACIAVLLMAQAPAAPPTPAAPAPAPSTAAQPTPSPTAAPPTPAAPTPAPSTAAQPMPAPPAVAPPPAVPLASDLQHVPPEQASAILGLKVVDQEGKEIGRLVDVLVGQEGQPTAGVIDFGGFMGVGSRKIAVQWSTLHFAPGDAKRPVTLLLTPDQIKAAPEFKNVAKPVPVVVVAPVQTESAAPAVAVPPAPTDGGAPVVVAPPVPPDGAPDGAAVEPSTPKQ
jgi:hypothetical protein